MLINIENYFKDLTGEQKKQFTRLDSIYREINARINLISRKDIDNLYINHILHSLSIARVINFNSQETVLDIGTGGGLPGIPLAIMFPNTKFVLADSIGKKVKAVEEIIKKLELKNVAPLQARVEDIDQKFDFAICRAVGRLDMVWPWAKDKIKASNNNKLPNGLFYLKGGDYKNEIPREVQVKEWKLDDLFPGVEAFESKSLLLLYPKKIAK